MSAPIGPGDYVECIHADEIDGARIEIGRLYCVEALTQGGACLLCGDDGPGVLLVGLDTRPLGWAWCACCLRPIYRPRADLVEQLKQPSPEREREHA